MSNRRSEKAKTRKAFTLIEAMTVVAIIGTLAALTTYVITSAQRQARDAKRKSDLTAIGVGFQARYEAQTCLASARARYPGYTDVSNASEWQLVTDLFGYTDACGAFTEFLSTIPTDPLTDTRYPYQFNLSNQGGVIGKHFRLRARLERTLTEAEEAERARISRMWVSNFGGADYGPFYNYFIGD